MMLMKLTTCCFFIGYIAVVIGDRSNDYSEMQRELELDDYEAMMGDEESFFPLHKRDAVTTIGNLEAKALTAHNIARQRHGVPELTYNKDLESHAITYARKLAATNTFKHDSSELQRYVEGENLYMAFSNEPIDICEAAFFWYNEIKKFDWSLLATKYNFFPIPSTLGHFTQMVWRDTRQLGCGGAYKISDKPYLGRYANYLVCRYKNPGNHRLQFSANVHQTVSSAPSYFRTYREICPGCSDKKPDCPSRAAECRKTFFVGEAARNECPKTCGLC